MRQQASSHYGQDPSQCKSHMQKVQKYNHLQVVKYNTAVEAKIIVHNRSWNINVKNRCWKGKEDLFSTGNANSKSLLSVTTIAGLRVTSGRQG